MKNLLKDFYLDGQFNTIIILLLS